MAWDDELNAITRGMVNDSGATLYTDDRVNSAILIAIRLVSFECEFSNTYTVDVVNTIVTPDPTIAPFRDENLIDLACLKTACILDTGSAASAANQALLVKDGASLVDLRSRFTSQLALLQKGWCATYDDLKTRYLLSQREELIGAAIMSPFRLFAGYGNDVPFGTTGIYRWGSR